MKAFKLVVLFSLVSISLLAQESAKYRITYDADAAEEWKQKLDKMQDIATFIMSSSVEKFKELGEKADVGDWIVKEGLKQE